MIAGVGKSLTLKSGGKAEGGNGMEIVAEEKIGSRYVHRFVDRDRNKIEERSKLCSVEPQQTSIFSHEAVDDRGRGVKANIIKEILVISTIIFY